MIKIESLVRKNVLELKPYSSARNELKVDAEIFLDANENPIDTGLNRYPDPMQNALKEKIGKLKNVDVNNILLGNGSDEVLDLIFRAFCEPKIDNVVSHNPSYAMYAVLASLNSVEYREINLEDRFQLNSKKMLEASDSCTKLFFICSPNNPSGNIFSKIEIKKLLQIKTALVIIDEAYIDFAKEESWLQELNSYKNLIICQTLSKAWGLAGLRVGICYASPEIIKVLNRIKLPYNLNTLSQKKALKTLSNIDEFNLNLSKILAERKRLKTELQKISFIETVYPSKANFLLIKVPDANKLYAFLAQNKISVRNRSNEYLCTNCLRISIGLPQENTQLLKTLQTYEA